MIKYSKDILIYQATGKLELYKDEEINQIKELAQKTSKDRLVELIYKLSELGNDIKWSTQKTIMFQAGIIKLCNTTITNNTQPEEKPIQQAPKVVVNPTPAQVPQTKPVKNTTTKKYSNNADEYWPQIIKDLKQNGKIVLYTNLMGTKAKEINDMTVGIEFPNGMTPFGKTVLEKQENIREISNLVSMACGKEMQIKYLAPQQTKHTMTQEENLQNFANQSDVPFNIIDE